MPNMVANGRVGFFPDDQVEWALAHGWALEDAGSAAARITEDALAARYSGVGNTIKAGVAAGLRGISGGITDAVLSPHEQEEFRQLRERNPILSTGAEIAGSLVTGKVPVSLGTRAATALVGTGAGALAKLGRAGVGGAVTGGIYGGAQTVTELSLSDAPVTAERIASSLSSNVLSGAGIGAIAGTASKALELSLTRGGSALRERAARLSAASKPDAQKAQVADDILAHQVDLGEKKIWLATKDADVKKLQPIKEAAKIARDADFQLRRLGNDPKGLAANPGIALKGLRVQEHALEMIQSQDERLRGIFAADASGTRIRSLDAVPLALERNRALQQQIAAVSAKVEKTESAAQKLAAGAAFSVGMTVAKAIPIVNMIPGSGILAGTAATSLVGGKIGERLSAASVAAMERTAKAVDAFAAVAGKAAPYTPVLATKVLEQVRFAKEAPRDDFEPAPPPRTKSKSDELVVAFKARSAEIRSHMTETPTGPRMRPEARIKLGEQLAPIRAVYPILADRIETVAARRLEFLAKKLPRKPDIAGLPIGPDRWQPSDMEMRAFARYVAAVEDPGGIEERLASGTITPEDAEVMREVYPEQLAEITRQIIEKLPTLRSSLPYHRQLALSILTGVPVAASMDPTILAALQAQYVTEPGTDGGAHAPVPMPQFGSVKKSDLQMTPAQERAQ